MKIFEKRDMHMDKVVFIKKENGTIIIKKIKEKT
jgi:hypothetical protein